MSERLPTEREARLLERFETPKTALAARAQSQLLDACMDMLWIDSADGYEDGWVLFELTDAGRAALDAYRKAQFAEVAPKVKFVVTGITGDVTRYDPDLAALAAAAHAVRGYMSDSDGKSPDVFTDEYFETVQRGDLRRLLASIDRVISKGELK